MHLAVLDWVIIVLTLGICFLPALVVAKRSSKTTAGFFAAGRSVPRWLAGLSMVATTFSADTPNLVTDIVRSSGVAGNWVWWAFVLTGLSTVFFYARLWRRSAVLTDLEFYEIRYSGTPASAVRGFRAVYMGLLFNCLVLATVNLAACKIAGILFGLDRWETLLFIGVLNVAFAAHSGAVGRAGGGHDPVFYQNDGGDCGGVFCGEGGGRAACDGGAGGCFAWAGGRAVFEFSAGLSEQLECGGGGIFDAGDDPVVGGVVSGWRRAGGRELYCAADAGIEVGAGCAGGRVVLQHCALRVAAVAVDSGGAGVADCVSDFGRYSDGVSEAGCASAGE